MLRVAVVSAVVGASLSGGALWLSAVVATGLTVASWRIMFANERRIEQRIEASEDRILSAIKEHVERRKADR